MTAAQAADVFRELTEVGLAAEIKDEGTEFATDAQPVRERIEHYTVRVIGGGCAIRQRTVLAGLADLYDVHFSSSGLVVA